MEFLTKQRVQLLLLQEGSIAVKIFSLWNTEVKSEAFPTRQIVCWIKLNASVAETAIRIQEILPGCCEWPQDCQDCCLDLCQLCFTIFGELISQVFCHVPVNLRYCAYLCVWSWVLLALSLFLGQTSPWVFREVCLH